jgi:3-hydroxyisobutyrate dehydrogenase-like beta-hydroxyacid dehydrogenase
MVREAQALGISLPALARTLQSFDQASEAGYGGIDGTRYPAYWIDHVGSTAPA